MLTRCKSGIAREFLSGHAQVEKWRRLGATRSKSRHSNHFGATGTKLRRASTCFCRRPMVVFQIVLNDAHLRVHRRLCKRRPHEFGPATLARPPPLPQNTAHMNLGPLHLRARREFSKHHSQKKWGPPHLRVHRCFCKTPSTGICTRHICAATPLPQTPST